MALKSNLVIRPYQQEMIDKFQNVSHVLCADDMGLGKTVEAIVLDQLRRESSTGPTLVVAPLSGVVDSWVKHFHMFTDLKIARIDPKDRSKLLKQKADVYVIHWDGLRLMWEELAKVKWLHVIADEAHRAKNRKTKQTKALKKLKPKYKTALTGTPMDNSPAEIWSICNWLYPQDYMFKSYWRFFHNFVDFIELDAANGHKYKKIVGTKNEDKFRELIDSFFIRRDKHTVLKDLPEKIYTEHVVELSPQERRIYDEMKREMLSWIGEHEDEPVAAPVVIAQLARLQQFALGNVRIVNGEIKLSKPSTKLSALLELLSDMDEDKQVVIFSKSKQMINLVYEELKDESVLLTGDTPQQFRDGYITQFQEGKAKYMLATIRTGGTGLNLQNADTVIFLDREWSPGENRQAEDRLHRSGQTNVVQVIDIVAADTIDQGKKQKLVQKWSWIKNMIGD